MLFIRTFGEGRLIREDKLSSEDIKVQGVGRWNGPSGGRAAGWACAQGAARGPEARLHVWARA